MQHATPAADGGLEHDPDLVDADRGEPPPPSPTPAPVFRSAVQWDRCEITPGLVRALSIAQAGAQTVDKRGRNEGQPAREGAKERKGYDYATAEDMIAEARRCMALVGGDDGRLWWTCAVRAVEPPNFDLGPNQWPCSLIVTESIVMHVSKAGEIGMWVTTAECMSIGSSGRPPDKADKAAETYLRGFIARDLLQLDRGNVQAVDDVDRRVDDDSGGAKGRQPAQRQQSADDSAELSRVKDATNAKLRTLIEAIGATGKPKPTIRNLTISTLGRVPTTTSDWRELHDLVVKQLDDVSPWGPE